MKYKTTLVFIFFCVQFSWASKLLIPMDDESQNNHLKAYGMVVKL